MPRYLILLPLILLLAACESRVTLENYDQITTGMTLVEVERILGRGTEETSHGGHDIGGAGTLAGAAATPDRTFIWQDNARRIVVTFADGKVVTKTQSGL